MAHRRHGAPGTGGRTHQCWSGYLLYFRRRLHSLLRSHGARGCRLMAGIVALAAIEKQVFHLSGWFLFYAGGMSLAVGGSNIYFAQRNRALAKLRMASDEIEHLAKVAERERIARDLHDVLGHTLSVIILKSELAGKLMDRDPATRRQRNPPRSNRFPARLCRKFATPSAAIALRD